VVRLDCIDLEVAHRSDERYSWVADDADSVRGETTWSRVRPRRLAGQDPPPHGADLHRHGLRLYAQLDAYEGAERVYAQSWRRTIPRDHV
jgi:hypothetical protein